MLRKLIRFLPLMVLMAASANASIVTMTNGRSVKVVACQIQGSKAHLTLEAGGEIWIPAAAIQSITVDEVDTADRFRDQNRLAR